MMRWFIRPRFTERQIQQAIADARAEGASRAMARSIDQCLEKRRRGRDARKARALRREADKRHERFINDPLIQATRS